MEDKEIIEEGGDEDFDKCVGQFRLVLNGIMNPLCLYGQKDYVAMVIEEVVSLAIQLHLKLYGVDMPYYVNHDKLRY